MGRGAGEGECVGVMEEREKTTFFIRDARSRIAQSVKEGRKEGGYTTATKASRQQGPSLADCRWASFEFLTLFR